MTASSASFAEFQRVVVRDPDLFSQLQAVSLPEEFASRAEQLGRERGFAFTADDVRAAFQAARRGWIQRNLA